MSRAFFEEEEDVKGVIANAGLYYSEKVTEKTPIPPPDWEALIAQIADEIIAEHTPARILQVRAKLYDLLSHCIPATTILKVGYNSSSQWTNELLMVY